MEKIQLSPEQPLFYQDGDVLHPTSLAAGPWYPNTQHGSAMLLMAALAADSYPSDRPRQVTRLTVDMMKAAPLEPITVRTELRKGGRYLEVLDISLLAAGEECVRASVLRFCIDAVPVTTERLTYQASAPSLPAELGFDLFAHAAQQEGFHHAVEVRVDLVARPELLWFRLKQPVLPELPASPLLRVALAADWTYSVPNIAHQIRTREGFGKLDFFGINPDTTINLHRQPEGEWIGIQTQATYGNLGAGTVVGQLFDQLGPVGFSTQSVLIRHRPVKAKTA